MWPLVQFDLEWVLKNWESEGFDLWEEVKSKDFFFNRMSYVYSFQSAANFVDNLEINGNIAATYRRMADTISVSLKHHWNGKFIYQCKNRQIDSSVIHAIATFARPVFGPSTNEAAATICVLCDAFYNEYPINQCDATVPGILIGRYPGDTYAGGNPWQLLTAVLAECFYLAAEETTKSIELQGGQDYTLDRKQNKDWLELLQPHNGINCIMLNY